MIVAEWVPNTLPDVIIAKKHTHTNNLRNQFIWLIYNVFLTVSLLIRRYDRMYLVICYTLKPIAH